MTTALDTVLNLYKRRSETPLQTIERYVARHTRYVNLKMTYAGRLDPMAEGLLLVLSGEKNKEREKYTGLDKDYEFEFILGVETDTYDVLGKIVAHQDVKKVDGTALLSEETVAKALSTYKGTFVQKYPAYSSKVIDGVPLFDLARKGKMAGVVLPEHEVTVQSIALTGSYVVHAVDFQKTITDAISAVTGDFRQADILALWNTYFAEQAPATITVYKARVSCGSGFYVRQLVSDIGRDLGVGAVTTAIVRTRVGEYTIKDSVK